MLSPILFLTKLICRQSLPPAHNTWIYWSVVRHILSRNKFDNRMSQYTNSWRDTLPQNFVTLHKETAFWKGIQYCVGVARGVGEGSPSDEPTPLHPIDRIPTIPDQQMLKLNGIFDILKCCFNTTRIDKFLEKIFFNAEITIKKIFFIVNYS